MIKAEVLESFRGKNIVITGGTGLIGRRVVEILRTTGANISVISLDSISDAEKFKNVNYVIRDLSCLSTCKETTKGADFVFHLAGVKGSIVVTKEKPASFFVPLLMMNTNVLEACRLNRVRKIIYTSSIGAYANAEIFREGENTNGPPMDEFPGWAKRMAELQIEAYRIQYGLTNFAIVRPCNVYGPGDNFDPENAMVIPSLMNKIRRGDNPVEIWGDGSAVRDFLHSNDAAEGIILALHYGTRHEKGNFVNIGSGQGYSIKELVSAMKLVVDFNFKFCPEKAAGFSRRVMDISLAKRVIHFEPKVTLVEGLKETWGWFLKHSDEYLTRKNYFKENENDR